MFNPAFIKLHVLRLMYKMWIGIGLILIMVTRNIIRGQEFTINPRNSTTFQLHGANFICEVIAPSGFLQWRLPNGQLIDKRISSSKWHVSESYQFSKIYTRLDIMYTENIDAGRYECVWSSEGNNSLTSAGYLNVVFPAPEDSHLCEASSTIAVENDLVTVTCAKRIEGNDHRYENENTLRWEINEVLEETTHNFIRVDNWNSRLWYNIGFSFYVTPFHNTLELTCRAVFFDGLQNDCVVGPINVMYAPVVIVTVFPSTIHDGDEVKLTCDSHANPEASRFEWYINGYLVDETEDYILKRERLYIPNVDITKHDSLIIGCFAINSQGRGKNSVLLSVDNSNLDYVGPLVSGILSAIILVAGLMLYLTTRNKKSLRVFLRTCVRASFKWQNEYTVEKENNQNESVMNNYRRNSRKKSSIVLQKYYRSSDRESDEARSTSVTSGRDTTLSISSNDSKEVHLSATEASTSGINEMTPSTRSGLMSCSSSSSISPLSFEGNESVVYGEAVVKDTDEYIGKSKVKNKQSGLTSTLLKTPKVKNTDSKIDKQENKQLDVREKATGSNTTLDKWSVTDITFEELDERSSVTPDVNPEWPVSIDRYNKSRNAKTTRGLINHTRVLSNSTRGTSNPTRALSSSTRGLGNPTRGLSNSTRGFRDSTKPAHHDKTRALWNNAGFVPIASKASNSGKIHPRGIYVKKHQKAIGSLHNQLNAIRKEKQKDSYDVNVVNDTVSVVLPTNNSNDTTQL